jgi:predicted MFS family arabinose efflux permease
MAHRLLRRLAGSLGVWNLVGNANGAMFVLLATRRLGLSEAGFGVLLACAAVGGVAGGVLAERIVARLGEGLAMRAALTFAGLASFAIPIFPNVVVVAVVFAIEGLCGVVWNVITLTLRQEVVPDRLLGRVTSAYRLVGVGTLPIGAALGGFIVNSYGYTATYWVSGVAITTLAVFAFFGFLARDPSEEATVER